MPSRTYWCNNQLNYSPLSLLLFPSIRSRRVKKFMSWRYIGHNSNIELLIKEAHQELSEMSQRHSDISLFETMKSSDYDELDNGFFLRRENRWEKAALPTFSWRQLERPMATPQGISSLSGLILYIWWIAGLNGRGRSQVINILDNILPCSWNHELIISYNIKFII